MKYVLDASVALKMVLTEQNSDRAQALREEFRNAIHELIAPDILPVEMGHALTKAERKGILKQCRTRLKRGPLSRAKVCQLSRFRIAADAHNVDATA